MGTFSRGDPTNLIASSKIVNNKYQGQKGEINSEKEINDQSTSSVKFEWWVGLVLIIILSLGFVCSLYGAYVSWNKKVEAKAEINDNLGFSDRWRSFNGGRGQMSRTYSTSSPGAMFEAYERDPYIRNVIEAGKVVKGLKTLFAVFLLVAGIFAVALVVSAILFDGSDKLWKKLSEQSTELDNNLSDLNSWAFTENFIAPVAGCLNFTTHEGRSVNDYLNGTSVYGSNLGYNIVTQPLNGKVTLGENGIFVYESNPCFLSNDTFTYQVKDLDLNLLSDVANVTVTVNPDQPPFSNNMTLYTGTNMALNGYLDGTDPDNDTLHYSMITEPLYGKIQLGDDGFFVYTPTDNFTGNDSFTYQTTDNVYNSTLGNVTVYVVDGKMPIAYNMIFNIAQNSILNNKFNVTGIDAKKTFNMVTEPLHGIFKILDDESFTYKPAENYNGQDRITYNFTDVLKQTSNIATINIFIRSPPTADNIKLSTKMNNLIGYNFKVKGYNSTPKILSMPQHGILKLLADQKFSYTPSNDYHGTDTFTYQAIDSLGQKSPQATVTITITQPPKLQTEPGTDKKTNKNNQNIKNPYKNLVNGLISPELNTNNLNLNITNLNLMNPENLMANPITNFINQIINHIKNTINKIKL